MAHEHARDDGLRPGASAAGGPSLGPGREDPDGGGVGRDRPHDHDHDHDHHARHDHHDHHAGHRRGHSHGHHGHHHVASGGRAFAIGTGLNLLFVVVEIVYGVLAHSVALVADAAHNLSDVLGLLLAWGASALARRKPSRRHTYGLKSSTILAGLANALLLLVAVGGVAWEAVRRFGAPGPVEGRTMWAVAGAGVVVNAASAALFFRDREHDVNVRGAFLHLAADAAVSAGVVIAGVAITLTGWAWLDPATSLLVSAVILVGTWSLLRDALNLALDAVPAHIDPEAVRRYLAGLEGVIEVHDLHIWAMSTTEVALTAHLVMAGPPGRPSFLRDACNALHERFRIGHSTLQIEPPDAPDACRQASDEVV
jgi:cobalt-zinc-cadmium efflux system protein